MDLSFRLVRACAFAERVASLFLSNHTNWTLGNSPEPAETNSLRNAWVIQGLVNHHLHILLEPYIIFRKFPLKFCLPKIKAFTGRSGRIAGYKLY